MYYELNAKDIQQHTYTVVEFHVEFIKFFLYIYQGCGTSGLGLLEGSITFGISEECESYVS